MNFHNKTVKQLLAMQDSICFDPANKNPKGSLYMYIPAARTKLEKIAWAITNIMKEKREKNGNLVIRDGYSGQNSNKR